LEEKKYSNLIDPENVNLDEILNTLEDLVAKNEEIPGLVRLFTVLVGESIRSDHPSHDYFVNRYAQIREVFSEYFGSLNAGKKLSAGTDIDQLAILIIAMMDGLQIQWLLDPESVSMSKSFNLFLKIIQTFLEE